MGGAVGVFNTCGIRGGAAQRGIFFTIFGLQRDMLFVKKWFTTGYTFEKNWFTKDILLVKNRFTTGHRQLSIAL